MYLFVLKKTVADRSPEGYGKLLEEMFVFFLMHLKWMFHCFTEEEKKGTSTLTAVCMSWWVCGTLMTEKWMSQVKKKMMKEEKKKQVVPGWIFEIIMEENLA